MTYGSLFAKNNVTTNRDYGQPVFFDKKNPSVDFSALNGVIVPTPSMIQQKQLEKIEQLQKDALDKRSIQNERLNQLFKSGDINSLENFYLQGQEATLNDVITKLVNQVGSIGLAPTRQPKTHNSEATYKQWTTKFQNLYNMLLEVQKQLSINTTIFQGYLDELIKAMNACELQDAGINGLKKWANQAYQFQGDLVEAIGTAWLNKLKIPKLQTVTLGNVSLRGEVSKGRHTGQLIQDMIVLDMSIPDIENLPFHYTTAGGEVVNTTLKGFIQALDSASNKKEERIDIDDSAYDILLKYSALNIQAKSGKNQLPWNVQIKSKVAATSVSIGEFDSTIASGIGIKRAFSLLHSLNLYEDLDIADKSADYNALANYGLSTMLAKVLHLSEKEGNQVLLTPSGFISYTDRMKQLFKDGNDYVMFVENITLNEDTLGTYYHVTIASKPKGY